jgi:beta-glucanase (GH16 family)
MLPDNELSERCLDGGEMDIMEMINGDSNAFSTYHWLSSWPEKTCGDFNKYHKSRNSMIQLQDYNDQFHEFGVERSGDHITYAVDNRVVHHVPASKLNIKLSHDPFYLIMNTAVGGSWPGEPTSLTRFPTEHVIDYVKVARKAKAADSSTENQVDMESTMPLGDSDGGSNWADHLGGSSLMELGEVDSNLNVFGPPPLSVA